MLPAREGRVKTKLIAPRKLGCPQCGKPGRRREVVDAWARDIAYREVAWVHSRLGLYESRCLCQEFFQAENPAAPHHWTYTLAVREAVVNAIVRDHLSVQKVLVRFREDYLLELSEGYVFRCLTWADRRFDIDEYFKSIATRFSGVLCLDEVYDGDYKVVFATDPRLNETIGFRVVEGATREQVEPFLVELRERGIKPESVMTDDSALYPDMLKAVWPDVDHRTCVFHFLKSAGQAIVRATRKIAARLPGARRRRRGRPCKRGRRRTKVSRRKFVTKHRYLIVKKDESLTEKDTAALSELLSLHPDLKVLREFAGRLRGLFEPGLTQQQARYRRTRLLQWPILHDYPQLRKITRRLTAPSFEKLISFLKSDDGQRTNNHVERRNRDYRMIQKTRYRHRTKARIEQAIRLDLARRTSCPHKGGQQQHGALRQREASPKRETMAA